MREEKTWCVGFESGNQLFSIEPLSTQGAILPYNELLSALAIDLSHPCYSHAFAYEANRSSYDKGLTCWSRCQA